MALFHYLFMHDLKHGIEFGKAVSGRGIRMELWWNPGSANC